MLDSKQRTRADRCLLRNAAKEKKKKENTNSAKQPPRIEAF